MKFTIFGYEIIVQKKNALQAKASEAKVNKSLKKIYDALKTMDKKQIKYSEYALQKESGVSINTIKKYRSEIDSIRSKNQGLFS